MTDDGDAPDEVPLHIAGTDAADGPGRLAGGSDGADGERGDGPAPAGPHPGDGTVSDDADDADEETVRPVELLVAMAEDGEIDPWDIDIVAVTDEFLARLDESDLRTGGRALFYASVLLRMKSEVVVADDPGPGGDADADDSLAPGERPAGAGPRDPVAALEREMDRRLERKHARGVPRTLEELVRELRDRERGYKESRTYDTSGAARGKRGPRTVDYRAADAVRPEGEPSAAEVTATAHGEGMEELIADVYVTLTEQYDRGREAVLFREISDAAGSTVRTFLAVLFLSHRGQVRLRQDEFFGDLWIDDPAAATDGEEAVAD